MRGGERDERGERGKRGERGERGKGRGREEGERGEGRGERREGRGEERGTRRILCSDRGRHEPHERELRRTESSEYGFHDRVEVRDIEHNSHEPHLVVHWFRLLSSEHLF